MSEIKKHIPKIITQHDVRAKLRSEGGFNTHIAVSLTRVVSTMYTAYAFALLAIVGLLAIIGVFPPIVALLVVWFSQTFLQLVFLPILSVGQAVLGQHQEMMSTEQYQTTNKTYADIETVLKRLDAQDKEMLDMAGKISQVEQIEQVETLKQSDALEEILNLIREHDAILKALPTKASRAKA